MSKLPSHLHFLVLLLISKCQNGVILNQDFCPCESTLRIPCLIDFLFMDGILCRFICLTRWMLRRYNPHNCFWIITSHISSNTINWKLNSLYKKASFTHNFFYMISNKLGVKQNKTNQNSNVPLQQLELDHLRGLLAYLWPHHFPHLIYFCPS